MRSKILQDLIDETPDDVKIFTDLYADLVVRINTLIKAKYGTQKALAEDLDKKPSEITKWLSGNHNLTLKTIAKLSAALGEPLLQVPGYMPTVKQVTRGEVNLTVHVNSKVDQKMEFKQATSKKLFYHSKVLAS